jgi:branched-chain amino acid transport system ATP-binding protein
MSPYLKASTFVSPSRRPPMGDETTGSVLSITDLHVSFGGNTVLNGVDLDLTPGFMGLVGPNGAGKTTLFNVITGYVRPSSGTIRLRGHDVTATSAARIARAGVSRTFQRPHLVPDLSVLDNVMLGVDGRPRMRGRQQRDRAIEFLDTFGLSPVMRREASALPLALQKVAEVARALMSEPSVLLLDEPAAGLSAEDVEHLVSPLMAAVADSPTAVLIIEHDIELVSRVCQSMTVLNFGHLIATGTPAEVLQLPEVVHAYLGAGFASIDS